MSGEIYLKAAADNLVRAMIEKASSFASPVDQFLAELVSRPYGVRGVDVAEFTRGVALVNVHYQSGTIADEDSTHFGFRVRIADLGRLEFAHRGFIRRLVDVEMSAMCLIHGTTVRNADLRRVLGTQQLFCPILGENEWAGTVRIARPSRGEYSIQLWNSEELGAEGQDRWEFHPESFPFGDVDECKRALELAKMHADLANAELALKQSA